MDGYEQGCPSRHQASIMDRREKLVYGNVGNSKYKMVAFCDAGHNPRFTEGKSRMGYVVKINGAAVIWDSRLQTVVAQSTAEAEYIALAETCKAVLYARTFVTELGIKLLSATAIMSDSQSAILIAKNGATNRQTRHISLRYHLIRDSTKYGKVCPTFIRGENNPADQLTRRLCESKTTSCRNVMMKATTVSIPE
eukprot:TRINITY_DN12599_c1_g7_i1.p1 TRINITY_DN12599_c1_g7~~TRINITY_DN12599_c1_g7_i1.p1  ORF type:complete len:195 (+),score=30.41 TRINITY_DN12599_c1_g7_i1:188-772(+)